MKSKSDIKGDQTMGLLQKVLTIQTAAFSITNCGSFYDKLRQLLYYKTGQFLLQNVAAITKHDSVITKYGSSYKTGQLLQNRS